MNFHHHFSRISNGLRCCKQDPKNTKKLQKNILLLSFWGIHQQHWLSWSGQGCGKVPWKHDRTSNLVNSLDSTSPSSMCHSILRDGPKQGRMPPVLPSGSFIWNEAFSLQWKTSMEKKILHILTCSASFQSMDPSSRNWLHWTSELLDWAFHDHCLSPSPAKSKQIP